MRQRENCIYCRIVFDASRGEADHILSCQLGEFENDIRFRRICRACNSRIGKCEEQFLRCAPELYGRMKVNPKVPTVRRRRQSQKLLGAMGAPGPQFTMDCGDHPELVRLMPKDPDTV